MIRKYLLPILAILGIGFAILTVVNGSKTVPQALPVINPTEVPYVSAVAGAGIVEANTENIAVGTLVSGVVSEIYVSVGSKVKAGQPLFKIDDRDLKAQLSVKKASLKVAKENIRVAKNTLADTKNQLTLAERILDKRAISVEELDRRRYAALSAKAQLAQAVAEVDLWKAQIQEIEINLDRIIVRAPFDGTIFQVKIHKGEFVLAGITQTPYILFGNTEPMHVRVDVDENDSWRVQPSATAVAVLRGNRNIKTPLEFVQFEPYIIPKKSLTGDSTERVDTRVLQVIYKIKNNNLPIFLGQQMDVFIEAPGISTSVAR